MTMLQLVGSLPALPLLSSFRQPGAFLRALSHGPDWLAAPAMVLLLVLFYRDVAFPRDENAGDFNGDEFP